jgi:hypothetical protein
MMTTATTYTVEAVYDGFGDFGEPCIYLQPLGKEWADINSAISYAWSAVLEDSATAAAVIECTPLSGDYVVYHIVGGIGTRRRMRYDAWIKQEDAAAQERGVSKCQEM